MFNLSLRSIPDGFYSERTIPDCLDRLSARFDDQASDENPRPGQLRILGSIDGNLVSLRVAEPSTHPLLARRFNGRFATLDGKTVLAGYFSVDPILTTFIRAWLFMVLFCGIVFVTDLVIGTQKLAHRELAVVLWGIFVVLYGIVVYMSNRSAEDDIRTIRREIETALN